MQSVLSLLTGAVLIGLVYGLSFLPTATLAHDDAAGLADDESVMADEAEAPAGARQDTETGDTE